MNQQVTAIITSEDSNVQVTILSSSPSENNRKEVVEMARYKLSRLISGQTNASQRIAMAGLMTDQSLVEVLNGNSDYWVSDDGEYMLSIIGD